MREVQHWQQNTVYESPRESKKKLDSRDVFQVDILGPAYHSEFGHVKNS